VKTPFQCLCNGVSTRTMRYRTLSEGHSKFKIMIRKLFQVSVQVLVKLESCYSSSGRQGTSVSKEITVKMKIPLQESFYMSFGNI